MSGQKKTSNQFFHSAWWKNMQFFDHIGIWYFEHFLWYFEHFPPFTGDCIAWNVGLSCSLCCLFSVDHIVWGCQGRSWIWRVKSSCRTSTRVWTWLAMARTAGSTVRVISTTVPPSHWSASSCLARRKASLFPR